MRHLNGVYTRKFNRLQKRDGPLFRGHYKSVQVDEDGYQLYLSRYIHLNPVEAGLVKRPNLYPRSSYRYYINPKNSPAWLKTNVMHNQISNRNSLKHARNYKAFVEMGNAKHVLQFYSQKYTAPIFGSDAHRKRMLSSIGEQEDSFLPDIKRAMIKPTINAIASTPSKKFFPTSQLL